MENSKEIKVPDKKSNNELRRENEFLKNQIK